MIEVLYAAMAAGVLSGVIIVLRGGPANSLIGLNVATICAVTALVALDMDSGISFSRDIAFYLIFPGVFGVIIFSRFMAEVARG